MLTDKTYKHPTSGIDQQELVLMNKKIFAIYELPFRITNM